MRKIVLFSLVLILTGTLSANQNRPIGIPDGARFLAKHNVWVQESGNHQIVWFADGTRKAEGDLKQDQRDGAWVFFHPGGNKRAEGTYTAGRMEGPWKLYYKSGKLLSEGAYRNNSKTGEWTIYFESGTKKSRGTYAGGLKNGAWIEYYQSGVVFYKGTYLADLAHGTWTYYFQNGAFYQAGTYSEDVRIGLWKVCIAPGGPCGEENMRQNEPPRISGLPRESTLPANADPMSILEGTPPDDDSRREDLPPSLRSEWKRY